MERSLTRPALIAALLALAGCTTPVVRAIHSPFHPSNTDPITFSADASSTRGVTEIKILQRAFGDNGFCAAWVAGECVPLPTFADRTLKTCNFDPAQTSAHCEVTIDPIPDGSFVTYGATARNAGGETGEDKWIGFAAGRQADPQEPIAVYTRGSTASHIDVVLIPVGFNGVPGATTRDFETAARNLIVNGYLAHAQITDNRNQWNFYVNPVTGGLTQTISGSKVTQSVTPPLNWGRVSAIADAVGYTHTQSPASWRDAANFVSGGVGYFTIKSTTPLTIVHETGHAVFGLSDEYCCDGGIVTVGWPHANMFNTQADCQASATAHGVATSSCVQITATNGFCGGKDGAGNAVLGTTNNKWREDAASDLMGCGANASVPAGLLDSARISWYYDTF